MTIAQNTPLLIGATLSAIASLLHVCIIFGGAQWYRFFGAGERMASAATAGSWYPTLVTSGIALLLLAWAAYALSGAGKIPPLPLIKPALCFITSLYLVRGLFIFVVLALIPSKVTPFLVWSSAISLVYGVVHLLGVIQAWNTIGAVIRG
jgi:hypothetical protein